MGEVTNQPKSLEERIRTVTKVARERNIDLELFFSCTSGLWGSNCNDTIRPDLGDLLDSIEEDLNDFGGIRVKDDPLVELLDLPEEPKYQPWKP